MANTLIPSLFWCDDTAGGHLIATGVNGVAPTSGNSAKSDNLDRREIVKTLSRDSFAYRVSHFSLHSSIQCMVAIVTMKLDDMSFSNLLPVITTRLPARRQRISKIFERETDSVLLRHYRSLLAVISIHPSCLNCFRHFLWLQPVASQCANRDPILFCFVFFCRNFRRYQRTKWPESTRRLTKPIQLVSDHLFKH